MTTVHLVYPHGDRINCPHAIGRKLAERLSRRYDVRLYDIDEPRALDPGPDDVVIGHPHAAPWSVMRRSAARKGWKRVLVLMPYVHADTYHVSLADPVVRHSDLYLAITGSTWFDSVPGSITAHWRPKMIQVDLAVDRADFPRVKTAFAEPGKRRYLYIGNTGWYKNTRYLSELAALLPEVRFSWIGSGGRIDGLELLGRQDFATQEGRALVAEHDFLLTVGAADANPSTILEAMAWGLVPVCTPESGYAGYPGIVNVPLADPDRAAEILRSLQWTPEADLLELRAANDEALDRHFNWDRFAAQVVDAIESHESPALLALPRGRRLRLRLLSTRRQLLALGPKNVRTLVRALLGRSSLGKRLLAWRRGRRAVRPRG